MTEITQVCVHYLSGNCKYGEKCTKVHTSPTSELLADIERKGTAICNYYPNCKFNSDECKRLHIMTVNDDITELRKYFYKILELNITDPKKIVQVDRIKDMIKLDLDIVKDTYDCLQNIR